MPSELELLREENTKLRLALMHALHHRAPEPEWYEEARKALRSQANTEAKQ
jgi:hypothetical protein